jgi:uncharacterized metal-binding protein YceD (DUF177 family)
MQILFKKITSTKYDFNLDIESLKVEGVYYRNKALVCIDALVSGETPNICFRCGENFTQIINTNLELKICQNKYIKSQDNELLDIIEVFNDKICFNEIFISEINSFKSDYFACKKCQ